MSERLRFLAALPRRALVYELNIWRSLYRWVFRRRRTDPEAAAFSYSSLLTPVLLAFIGLSALELPIVHLLLPWETVRNGFLAVGVWGLLWMVGLLASIRIHPHAVEPRGLRVRYSFDLDVLVPWDLVADVRRRRRSLRSGRKVQLERAESGATLHVAISSTTNVEVALRQPLPVRLPSRCVERVTAVHLYADDPEALVRCVRERLAVVEAVVTR